LNREIDDLIVTMLAQQGSADLLYRGWFIRLPHAVASEVMAAWLRAHRLGFERRTIQRLVVFTKTALPGKRTDIGDGHGLHASKDVVTLTVPHREQ
jgi:N6-adenosine-specific RNA methylase IME4